MKKNYRLFLIVFTVSFMLFGCSAKESTKESEIANGKSELVKDEEPVAEEIVEESEEGITNIKVGEELILGTLKFTVKTVEETKELKSKYGETVYAKDGTKFILVGLDITNITKSGFDAPDGFLLVDNEEGEYSAYSESFSSIDNYLNYRNLAPSIKESGSFVYEVPEDSTNYYFIMGKVGSDEIFKVTLK